MHTHNLNLKIFKSWIIKSQWEIYMEKKEQVSLHQAFITKNSQFLDKRVPKSSKYGYIKSTVKTGKTVNDVEIISDILTHNHNLN